MIKTQLFTLCFFICIACQSQIISTIAGGMGDGLLATNTSICSASVAIDALDNLYIADLANYRIRKVAANTGIITTVAGNGIKGGDGDGGEALFASLSDPISVALDNLGNIYIGDVDKHNIRKVDAFTGKINTVVGNGYSNCIGDGGLATLASINSPTQLSIDDSGNIYIADEWSTRIRKVSANTGIINTIAGNGQYGYSGDGGLAISANLSYTQGVAIDKLGNIYIADSYNNRIRKVTASTGIINTIAGNGIRSYSGDNGLAILATLNMPSRVTVDNLGDIYITDSGNNRIRKITVSTGIITTIAGNETRGFGGDGDLATLAILHSPFGVTLDKIGNIYIPEGNNDIRKITVSTGIITTVAGNRYHSIGGDGSYSTLATLNTPSNLAIDKFGNIYIADTYNNRIRKITCNDGIINTIAGNDTSSYKGDNDLAILSELNHPTGVAIDDSGNLFIADFGNHRIRKVVFSTGIITTIAGNGIKGFSGDGGNALFANLNYPCDIAIDGSGNLYIADIENNRIRKIIAGTSIISTIAGNGLNGFDGDGGDALFAKLNYPSGVTVDKLGNLYIADNGNNRIRKIIAGTSIINTIAGDGSNSFEGDGGDAIYAKLNHPRDVAVDDLGNLYIADNGNNRIRKITVGTSIISTVAGNGLNGFDGDGGDALYAKLNHPSYIAIDGLGNLYITDDENNRIRKVRYNYSIGCAPNEIFSENELKIFPNPTKSELHIFTSSSNKYSVQLLDITGKEISEKILFTHSTNIYLQGIIEGIYFLKIVDENIEVSKVEKIVFVR